MSSGQYVAATLANFLHSVHNTGPVSISSQYTPEGCFFFLFKVDFQGLFILFLKFLLLFMFRLFMLIYMSAGAYSSQRSGIFLELELQSQAVMKHLMWL